MVHRFVVTWGSCGTCHLKNLWNIFKLLLDFQNSENTLSKLRVLTWGTYETLSNYWWIFIEKLVEHFQILGGFSKLRIHHYAYATKKDIALTWGPCETFSNYWWTFIEKLVYRFEIIDVLSKLRVLTWGTCETVIEKLVEHLQILCGFFKLRVTCEMFSNSWWTFIEELVKHFQNLDVLSKSMRGVWKILGDCVLSKSVRGVQKILGD